MDNNNIFSLIYQLWGHIKNSRKIYFLFYILLTFICALVEIVSIGSIIPFLTIFIDPDKILNYEPISFLLQYLNIKSSNQLFLPITVFFCSTVILSGILRILLLKLTIYVSVICGSDLSNSVYNKTLYQPYLVHVKRNSSEIIAGIISKTGDVINGVIWTFMSLVSSLIIMLVIIIFLIIVNPKITFAIFFVFGLFYSFVTFLSLKKLKLNSQKIALEQTQVVKALQEGLGSIRDVLIDGTQKIYAKIYKKADYPLRIALGNNQMISLLPKYIIESLGLIFIAMLAYMLSFNSNDFIQHIPMLGALALGAQKLLPSFQSIYYSWTRIIGSRSSLIDFIQFLDQPVQNINLNENYQKIYFNKTIEFKNIHFRYSDNKPWILKNLNFKIKKNSKFGIVGKSGSGKSTIIDIISGLLEPTKGNLFIDNTIIDRKNIYSLQNKIAYVPQNIFLSQATFSENIAFGIELSKIEDAKVKESAKRAQIFDFINSTSQKFNTRINERGLNLSGGQRQRIAIARALYKQAEILILDEATNALDYETELAFIDMLDVIDNKLTIIIIAHNTSTIKKCDYIISIKDGEIIEKGDFLYLLKKDNFVKNISNKIKNNII